MRCLALSLPVRRFSGVSNKVRAHAVNYDASTGILNPLSQGFLKTAYPRLLQLLSGVQPAVALSRSGMGLPESSPQTVLSIAAQEVTATSSHRIQEPSACGVYKSPAPVFSSPTLSLSIVQISTAQKPFSGPKTPELDLSSTSSTCKMPSNNNKTGTKGSTSAHTSSYKGNLHPHAGPCTKQSSSRDHGSPHPSAGPSSRNYSPTANSHYYSVESAANKVVKDGASRGCNNSMVSHGLQPGGFKGDEKVTVTYQEIDKRGGGPYQKSTSGLGVRSLLRQCEWMLFDEKLGSD